MPLTIINALEDPLGAINVQRTIESTDHSLQGDADMGRYWISRKTPQAHALTTCGAGPCTIIAVLDAEGGGGLGHYPGTHLANEVLQGLAQMVRTLGGAPITDVLFAAGDIGGGADQASFDQGLLAGAGQLCPLATIFRVTFVAPDDVAGAAMFLPRRGEIALFGDDMTERFYGTGGDDGLLLGSYG